MFSFGRRRGPTSPSENDNVDDVADVDTIVAHESSAAAPARDSQFPFVVGHNEASSDEAETFINLEGLDPKVRGIILEMDLDNDGRLSVAELRDAVRLFKDVRSNIAGINYTNLPKEVQEVLATFDEDKSGTVDVPELALGAKLYAESKQQTKRLRKVIIGMSCLILLLMAALTGLVFAVVELSKETKAKPDGRMIVAGSNDVTVKTENPGFTTSTTTSAAKTGAAARRRSLLAEGGAGGATALVDTQGVAVATSALTSADGTQQDAYGNDVATKMKSYEYSFGGKALTDLLFAKDKSHVASLQTLETTREDGSQVTLVVTGHDFRDVHFVRDAATGNLTAAETSSSTPGVVYDLAAHVLVLHTSNARYPAILVAATEPLSEAEKARSKAMNISMPVSTSMEVDAFLDAFYADDSASANSRKLLWGDCNVWCQLNNLKSSYDSAKNQVNAWKTKAQDAISDAGDQLEKVNKLVTETTRLAKWSADEAAKISDSLMSKIREKVQPLSKLSGCDIIGLMQDEINKYLAKKPLCVLPGCSGSHLNSGEIDQMYKGNDLQIEAQTDLKACFQLYALELDCTGLDAAMKEFWAENELDASISEAIADNQALKNLRQYVDQIKGKLDSWGLGRRRLMSIEEDAFAGLDEDAIVEEIHAATKQKVGDSLADFMRRRKLAQKPQDIIKIKALRGRTTVDFSTHVEIETKGEAEWDKNLAEELGELEWGHVFPVPGTVGLVTVETGVSLDVAAPVVISTEGVATAHANLKVTGITHDQNFFDSETDPLVSSGSTEGTNVWIQGSVGVSAAIQLTLKTKAQLKICFAGVCAGLATEAYIDSAAGVDGAVTTTGGGSGADGNGVTVTGAGTQNGCNEWTFFNRHSKFAKYSQALVDNYDAAVTAAGGGLVVGGGAWLYVTFPYMKVYPEIEAGDDDSTCNLAADNIFEFKPTKSLKDDLLEAQMYEHPFGKYLVRTGWSKFSPVGPTGNQGVFNVSMPTYSSPSSWDGVLPAILPPSTTGRRLLATPVGGSGGDVQCTEFNGGQASGFVGSIPAARASCSDRVLRHPATGAAIGSLCWSRDCCHGHAVKTSWSRVQCVPTDLAGAIKPGNALP